MLSNVQKFDFVSPQRKYQNKTTNVYTKRLKSNRKIIIELKETMCLMLFNVYVQCANVALPKGHVSWFNKLVFVCVYMSFFSFSFYLKRKNKKSNQILAIPKLIDWNIWLQVFARPYMFIFLYFVLHIIVPFPYRSTFVNSLAKYIHFQTRYIWRRRASSVTFKLVYV